MLGLGPAAVVASVLVVFVGASVQGSLGFGLGMIASPVLTMIDHAFVPGAVMIAVLPLSVGVVVTDRAHVEWYRVGLALTGRVPGVVLGSLAVAAWSDRLIAFAVAASVLLAVVASATTLQLRPDGRTLLVAGGASGFMGTTTGVGGPPMALTYQHSDPRAMRATLAAFFTIGAVMSVVGLVVSGEIGTRQWQLALLLLPSVVAGLLASRVLNRLVDADRARPVILAACTLSALVLLAQQLV